MFSRNPTTGEELNCVRERTNTEDPYAVAAIRRSAVVGLSYYIWSPPPPLSGPPGLLVAATDGPPDHQWLP